MPYKGYRELQQRRKEYPVIFTFAKITYTENKVGKFCSPVAFYEGLAVVGKALADAYEELNYCLAECCKKMGNGMRNVTEKLLCVVGKSLERIELFVFNICH